MGGGWVGSCFCRLLYVFFWFMCFQPASLAGLSDVCCCHMYNHFQFVLMDSSCTAFYVEGAIIQQNLGPLLVYLCSLGIVRWEQ